MNRSFHTCKTITGEELAFFLPEEVEQFSNMGQALKSKSGAPGFKAAGGSSQMEDERLTSALPQRKTL